MLCTILSQRINASILNSLYFIAILCSVFCLFSNATSLQLSFASLNQCSTESTFAFTPKLLFFFKYSILIAQKHYFLLADFCHEISDQFHHLYDLLSNLSVACQSLIDLLTSQLPCNIFLYSNFNLWSLVQTLGSWPGWWICVEFLRVTPLKNRVGFALFMVPVIVMSGQLAISIVDCSIFNLADQTFI